jgi:hypothetical protein
MCVTQLIRQEIIDGEVGRFTPLRYIRAGKKAQ